MRTKKRLTFLYNFFKKKQNIFNYFHLIALLPSEQAKIYADLFLQNFKEIKQFHRENPDLRIAQVIQGKLTWIPGSFFYLEDWKVLTRLGVEGRECMFWGINYTKSGKLLKNTKWKLIKDLEFNHIENILRDVKNIDENFRKEMIKELALRKN